MLRIRILCFVLILMLSFSFTLLASSCSNPNNDNTAATHTITASTDTDGSISPSGAVIVDDGDNKSFTVTPDTGYRIADVLVDGVSVGIVNSYAFSDVTANHTIQASFRSTSWSSMTSGTTERLRSIWGSSSSDVFAVGGSGTILHYDGTAWSEMSSGTTEHLYNVWGSSSSDVFAVGYDGTILHL